jgi:hypothetical protein
MGLLTALWFGTAVVSAGPGVLLLGFADSRLASTAALTLLLAGVVAACGGVACARGIRGPLLVVSAAVVLLCLAAPSLLGLDGRVSPGGFVMSGGAAAALAVLAGALTVRASRGRGSS